MRVQRKLRYVSGWSLATLLLTAMSAQAVIVGGGGSSRTDCLLVLNTNANAPTGKPKNVVCVDGDPTCDSDGLVNGICDVPVGVCANHTMISDCSLVGIDDVHVEHSDDDGVDPDFDPNLQALQSRINSEILDDHPNTNANDCTAPTSIRVPIKGPLGASGNYKCGKRSKTMRLTTTSDNLLGTIYTDKDKLKITCVPADAMVGGCDPQTHYTGTFDRIQKQVFNQSCAVATCHDSNSTSAALLLETGASYTNLVNVNPVNGAALGQGWKRVLPGNSASSFIFHKVTGELPDSTYGGRMPFKRSRLHTSLQTLLQIWIDAGANNTGWDPGTF